MSIKNIDIYSTVNGYTVSVEKRKPEAKDNWDTDTNKYIATSWDEVLDLLKKNEMQFSEEK